MLHLPRSLTEEQVDRLAGCSMREETDSLKLKAAQGEKAEVRVAQRGSYSACCRICGTVGWMRQAFNAE